MRTISASIRTNKKGSAQGELMDLETLQSLAEHRERIQNLQAEIKASANSYHSPMIMRDYRKQNYGKSHTERAALRKIEMEEELKEETNMFYDQLFAVEKWLETVKDPAVSAAVRWHYILGKPWPEVSKKLHVRGVQKRVYRYCDQ